MKKLLAAGMSVLMTGIWGIEYQYSPKLNHVVSPREAINLCGEWDFRAIPKKANAPLPDWRKVNVPHSDYTQKNFGGIKEVHYRKTFTLPDVGNRKTVLRFECVPGTSETFLNGQKIGLHHPGGTPFSYDLSKLLKKGKNELEVRVSYRDKENTNHRPFEHIWSIWGALGLSQPLYLEMHNPVYVEDVTIRTVCEPEKEFFADVVLRNDTAQPRKITLTAAVAKEWNVSQNVELSANAAKTVRVRRKWDRVRLWTPSTPNLYFLDLSIKSGDRTLDAFRQRFGFREIRIEKDKLLMNGHPFLVRRDTCVGGETAYPSDAAVREIARRYKARGINGLRIAPRKIARWVEIADEEGLMISTMANQKTGAGRAADDFWPNMTEYLLETVKHYKNHPSVICWGISNEFGGVYHCQGKEKTVIPKHQALGFAVEHADPTRPWTAYGDIEVGFPVRGPGPAKIRSFHYPMPPTIATDALPELAYWYSKGKTSWQGISTKDKPLSISEDLYHGMTDQFFGMSKWAGDSIYTVDGYTKAWFDAVRMYAEGYYDAGIAGWEVWVAFPAEKYNKLYDDHGQLIPDYLIALREPYPNLSAGTTEKRNLAVYNKTFLEQNCELIRKDTVNGKTAVAKTWKFKLSPGGAFRAVTELSAPECEKITGMKTEYILKSGDKILTRRVYDYNLFPALKCRLPENAILLAERKSPLRGMAKAGQCTDSAEQAVKTGKPIIVHKILNSKDGEILNRFTMRGGKVLLIEADEKSWTPSALEFRRPQSFVWRRNDDALPGVTESMLRCWKPDTRLGDSGYIKDPAEAVEVLLDSGHGPGLTTAHLLRCYNGKGSWMLCQLPLVSRFNQEPAAPFLLERTIAEFMKEAKKTKHLTLFPDDPFVRMLKNEHFELDQTPDDASVIAVDASVKLSKERTDALKRHAENGGAVLLLGVTNSNKTLLDELGTALRPVKECEWVIRKNNRGLLAGITNEDLFFSNLKLSAKYFQAPVLNKPQTVRLDNILTGALELNPGARGTVLTEPGAIAEIPFGKGRFVLTSLNWRKFANSFPKRTFFTLRTLLLNLGANTAYPKKNTELETYEMRWIINRQFWKDPKKPGVPAWFENGNDMRYFPVNLCGWSPDSNNFCPVEPFPKDAMNFGGIKFKLSAPSPKGKFTGALVLAPGETKTFGFWTRGIIGFHFLGALEKPLKEGTPVLSVSYGYRYKGKTSSAKKAEFCAGDHLNIYRWTGKVKSGKAAWVGPTQQDKTGTLYSWYMKSGFRSDGLISYMDLTNIGDCQVAIVALTLEKERKK